MTSIKPRLLIYFRLRGLSVTAHFNAVVFGVLHIEPTVVRRSEAEEDSEPENTDYSDPEDDPDPDGEFEEAGLKRDKKRKNGFRFQGKNVALTYPQCNMTMEEFGDMLYRTFGDPDNEHAIDKIAMGRERHNAGFMNPNGNMHFHVYLHYFNKLRTRDVRHWDLVADDGTTFHPNIKPFKAKDTKAQVETWICYAKKGGTNRFTAVLDNAYVW